MAGIRLEWAQFGDFDSFDVIRSDAPTDINALPSPIVTNLPTMYYVDTTVVVGVTYYYRVVAWRDGVSKVSLEIGLEAQVGDEHWDKVVALLHFDGDDNAQSYIDVRGHTFNATGGPTLTTLQSKFGASSLQLSAVNGNNIACTHSDFIFSTADYTIECFFKVAGGNNNIFACDAGALYINESANLATLYAGSNVLSKSGVSTNIWMHVALVRLSNTVYIFLNGEKSSGWTDSRNHNTGFIKIGGSTVGDGGLFFVDEFRITKGVARYTENFTPPTVPFLNS